MSVTSKKKLLAKLRNKSYRDAYVAEHVKTSVPIQTRTLRDQHELTQAQLAQRAKTTQTVISRIEDPNYGNLSINSLIKIANALDVGLLVKFVPFSRLLKEFENVSPEALSAKSISDEAEVRALEEWASEESRSVGAEIIQERSVASNVLLFPLSVPVGPGAVLDTQPSPSNVRLDNGASTAAETIEQDSTVKQLAYA